jgi:hypothetical protein
MIDVLKLALLERRTPHGVLLHVHEVESLIDALTPEPQAVVTMEAPVVTKDAPSGDDTPSAKLSELDAMPGALIVSPRRRAPKGGA